MAEVRGQGSEDRYTSRQGWVCNPADGCSPRGMRDAPPKPAEPRPGLYRHYKDNPYRVVGLALHSETREWLVVYEALYGEGGLFVRPAAMFTETVEVGGQRVPRFARVGD